MSDGELSPAPAGGGLPGADAEPAATTSGAAFGHRARLSVAFGRSLRSAGLEVPLSSVIGFSEALSLVDLARPEQVYFAGRAVFVRRPEDLPAYSRAFADLFGAARAPQLPPLDAADSITLVLDDGEGDPADGEPVEGETLVVRYSAAEVLAERDFASLSGEELAEVHRLVASLRMRPPLRRGRRLRPSGGSRGEPDLRRSVRRALRTSGETVRLSRRLPAARPRRMVLLVDVSGSMEPYARAFLDFAHAALVAHRHVEAFTLGTRLTRVTRELSWRDPDAALRRASSSVADLSGGTRLGACLQEFNERWGVAGLARGAVVIVLSDGWDRGDPEQLGAAMERLSRVAYKIVWANPLKAAPGYAPLARGIAAALPHVDEFVEAHSLASLQALAEVVVR